MAVRRFWFSILFSVIAIAVTGGMLYGLNRISVEGTFFQFLLLLIITIILSAIASSLLMSLTVKIVESGVSQGLGKPVLYPSRPTFKHGLIYWFVGNTSLIVFFFITYIFLIYTQNNPGIMPSSFWTFFNLSFIVVLFFIPGLAIYLIGSRLSSTNIPSNSGQLSDTSM